jgi:hypothetical protein
VGLLSNRCRAHYKGHSIEVEQVSQGTIGQWSSVFQPNRARLIIDDRVVDEAFAYGGTYTVRGELSHGDGSTEPVAAEITQGWVTFSTKFVLRINGQVHPLETV